MNRFAVSSTHEFLSANPVLSRLRRGGEVGPNLEAGILALSSRAEQVSARAPLQAGGEPARRPRFILSGWAARVRFMADGRRQIINVLLPGDGFGAGLQPSCFDRTAVTAITPMRLADAAPLRDEHGSDWSPEAKPAIEALREQEASRLLDHIMRLGRQPALERMAHFLLELYQRLDAVGLVEKQSFELPLTQEGLADVLGLSVVHVNRTLQQMRRERLIATRAGRIVMQEPAILAAASEFALG